MARAWTWGPGIPGSRALAGPLCSNWLGWGSIPEHFRCRQPGAPLQVVLLMMIAVEEQVRRAEPRRSADLLPAAGEPRTQLLGDHSVPVEPGLPGLLEPVAGQG